MRKALLVVTLILASFGGGAFVNGPGLVWVKGLMGLEPRPVVNLGGEPPPTLDEAPVVSVGPEPAPFEPPAPTDTVTTTDGDKPSAPQPEPRALAQSESPPASEPSKSADEPDSPSPPPLEPPAQAHSEPQPVTLDPIQSGVPTRQMPPAPASSTTPPRPALAGPGSPPSAAPALVSGKDEEPGWGNAPGSAPATAILPGDNKAREPRHDPLISGASMPTPAAGSEPRPSTAEVPSSSGPTWNTLKQAMTTRGVTRFWVEGEPSGSVTFRCVVPLAGRGAIAQQFEAQGEDVCSAAEAALKRIDLWKATERK